MRRGAQGVVGVGRVWTHVMAVRAWLCLYHFVTSLLIVMQMGGWDSKVLHVMDVPTPNAVAQCDAVLKVGVCNCA